MANMDNHSIQTPGKAHDEHDELTSEDESTENLPKAIYNCKIP